MQSIKESAIMIDDPLIIGVLVTSWIICLVVLVFVIRWVIRTRSRHKAAVADLHRDNEGVMRVPVLATFTGVAGMPRLFAVASNSLNPSLVIRPGWVDYRVTVARSVKVDDIASVRVQTVPGTTNLVFTFVGGVFTVSANVGDMAVAQAVLDAYPDLAAKRTS